MDNNTYTDQTSSQMSSQEAWELQSECIFAQEAQVGYLWTLLVAGHCRWGKQRGNAPPYDQPRMLQLLNAGQFQTDLNAGDVSAYADTEAWSQAQRQEVLEAYTARVPMLADL